MLILEILKSRIDKEVVEELDESVFSKRRQRKKIKLSEESEDSDFIESKKKSLKGKRL